VARVIWTPRALKDVARLHAFLAPKNRDAAKRAVRAIRSSVRALARYPEIGRPVEGMTEGFRERVIPFGSAAYVALYHYDGDVVAILAVRHGKEAGY
jgi:plasmid stabilization system protein ParE